MTGRSPSGRAGRPSDQAPAGLGDTATIPNAAPYGEPVCTVAELDELNSDEIVEGYFDGRRNEPPPTGNRSRSYWHGWRNGMADAGHMEIDEAMRELARQVCAKSKAERTRA